MNKNCKIGFIGCGKMASAIIKGVISSKFLPAENIKGSEVNLEVAENAKQRLGIDVITDNKELVKQSDVIFVATKPNYVAGILEEIKDNLTSDKLVVSIAAGVSTSKIENILGKQRVVRVMPNTPAMVLEGMSGVCRGTYAKEDDAQFVVELLSNIGKAIEVTEEQIDIVTAISKKDFSYLNKNFELYYVKNSSEWQLALKPKQGSKPYGVIKNIIISGSKYIDEININSTSRTQINFRECNEKHY